MIPSQKESVHILTPSDSRPLMRLADFILDNLEPILQAWENFARTISPATDSMTSVQLRDHAEQMLRVIAADLATPQTAEESLGKSHGKGKLDAEDTAAEIHALTRLISGFTIEQMVSEYRALRASVLLLWSKRVKEGIEFELEDMTRFNEAIDQALAESVVRFAGAVTESQHIFLGILGHDLRTPLGAISMGAQVLLHSEDLESKHVKIASRIYSSVGRAKSIVDSLLDFTRSHFGGGIPVTRIVTDLTPVCRAMVDEVRDYHPDHTILFHADESIIGHFDAERLEQVFCNLIENAVQHGDENTPVAVTLHATATHATFTVHNHGSPIPDTAIPYIFAPLKRLPCSSDNESSLQSGLGLGLYIAHQIVVAHEGRIEVKSTEDQGTLCTVTFPLQPTS